MSQIVRLEWAADNQVGYGQYGDVIMKEKAQKTLHKYMLLLEEVIYKETWSENFPHDVNAASVIGVCWHNSEYKPLLHDKSTSTTLVLSSDGKELLNSLHHEGVLLTYLCHDGLDGQQVYAVEKTYGECEIVIVDNKDISETRLQPVAGKPTWSHPYLSVCEDMRNDWIAVTSKDHTLDIYYRNGRTTQHSCYHKVLLWNKEIL